MPSKIILCNILLALNRQQPAQSKEHRELAVGRKTERGIKLEIRIKN
jgi:hypothetical protein